MGGDGILGSGPVDDDDASTGPAVRVQSIVRSAAATDAPPPPTFNIEQCKAAAEMTSAKLNASTQEEADALETAAAAVETGGKFVEINGYALSGAAGAIDIEYCEAAAAAEKVSGECVDKYFAFQTIDANPEGYPKIFDCKGHALMHCPESPYCSTVHIWRPVGCLPTADEATLFVDGYKLARPGSLAPKRPCRAEGLADEYPHPTLYGENIAPNDLRQGGLGNCWLISAFSAVAEFPEKIRALIKQTKLSKSGRYDVTLFHPVDEQHVTIAIDDRFPTDEWLNLRNVQLSSSGELWPVILEKAFAAMWNGYGNLDGGNPYVALKAMTGVSGDRLIALSRDTAWQCWTPKFRRNAESGHPEAPQLIECNWPDTGKRGSSPRASDKLLDLLMWCDTGKCVMCCGSGGHDDSHSSASGVVQGHAYALLRIETNLGDKKFDLMKLRNPHGQGGQEWAGNWCGSLEPSRQPCTTTCALALCETQYLRPDEV